VKIKARRVLQSLCNTKIGMKIYIHVCQDQNTTALTVFTGKYPFSLLKCRLCLYDMV